MKISRMIIISRPLFWLLTVLPFIIGIMFTSRFSLIAGLELLMLTMPFNFFLYGINDVYDIKSDSINRRKGNIQGAKLKKNEVKEVKRYAYIFAALFLIVSLFSFRLVHILFAFVFTFLCFAYSHPLFRLKGKPFFDTLSSSLGYMLPVMLSLSLFVDIFALDYFYALLIIPFMGIHPITALVDYREDKKSSILTTATFLGKRNTIYFALLTFIVGLIIFYNNLILSIMHLTMIVWCIVILTQKGRDFDRFVFPVSCISASFVFMTMLYFIIVNI